VGKLGKALGKERKRKGLIYPWGTRNRKTVNGKTRGEEGGPVVPLLKQGGIA